MFRASSALIRHAARCQVARLSSSSSTALVVAGRSPLATTHFTKAASIESLRFVRSYQNAAVATPAFEDETYPNFEDVADLHPLSKAALREKGITTMSEIQAKTWKSVLDGHDVLGRARTGTGKTLGFLLPGLEQVLKNRVPNQVGMLVLSPTRELALQIQEVANMLCSSHGSLTTQAMYGGTSKSEDMRRMANRVPDVLVATPGRILDHLNSSHVKGTPFPSMLQSLQVVVLDETDRLLDMGFRDDIDSILHFLPKRSDRQTLLFSATIPPGVKTILEAHLRRDFVTVDCIRDEDPSTHTNAKVDQSFVLLKPDRMLTGSVEILLHLMQEPNHKIMVFLPTNNMVVFYSALFNAMGKYVLDIHAKKTQAGRTNVSNRFRKMKEGVLFTSDVSARGVDYPDVTHVVQFGMTQDRETYIHRLGRTARAGKKGLGILILADAEQGFLRDLHGMDLHSNQHFQYMMDGPPTELLQKSLDPIVQSVRAGKLPNIEDAVTEVYQGLATLTAQRLKSINSYSPKKVVSIINSFVTGIGMTQMPPIASKAAQMAGILYEPDVNVGRGGGGGGDRYNDSGDYSGRGGNHSRGGGGGGFSNSYSRQGGGGYQGGGGKNSGYGGNKRRVDGFGTSRFGNDAMQGGFGSFSSPPSSTFGGLDSAPPRRQSFGGFDQRSSFGSDYNKPTGGFGRRGDQRSPAQNCFDDENDDQTYSK